MGGRNPEGANVLLPPATKRVELINFSGLSEALGGAIAPIASSVGRSESPKALNESHRNLPQVSAATASDR